MAAKGYSAGRVFLQVVPSYNNFMSALRRDAAGPLGKAIADTFDKQLGKAGVKSGETFSKRVKEGIRVDALTADLQKKLGRALNDISDDTSTFGRKLLALQKDIESTGRVTDDHIKKQRALAKELYTTGQAAGDQAKQIRLLAAADSLDPNTSKQGVAAQRELTREATAAARATKQAERAERDRSRAMRDGDRDTNVAARSLSRLSGILSGVRGDSQDGANAFRFFNFAILATAALGAGLIPVLAGVAGGLALLGPILGGLGAGMGVAVLGFSGVSDAVKALGEQEDATSASSTGYARTLRNAARSVADARRSLKDAYRNSGEAIERALESQEDAERGLAAAQRDARDAQKGLTEARKEAKAEQADLANKVAQNQLDERQGVLDLFDAYNQYGAVMADGGSTNLEREQADIALKQAQLNLKLVREEEKRLADEKKKSDKDGIEGSSAVQTATERLTDALERQKDAQRRLARATRDTARARSDGARSIADAQRSLNRAQEDYNDALQGGATTIDKVEQAMSKLSPEAQRFARYIFSLKEGFQQLRNVASAGILPGVEEAMRNLISTYGPGMNSFVRDMAADLGNLAVQAGETFANPVWRDFFSDMSDASRQFTRDATEGTLGFMTGFVALMDEALPSSRKLSTYIKEIGERFGVWAASDEGRERFRKFFAYVDRVGPRVKDFFVAFAGAITAVGVAFAPIGESILTALTQMFDSISRMDDGQIRAIGVGLAIIVIALQSAAGIMAVLSLAAAVATAPLLVLVGAAAGLAGAFLLLGNSSDKNKKFFTDLMETLKPVTDAVKDLYEMFKENLVDVWENSLLPAIKDITKALKKDLLPAFKRFWPVIRPLVGLLVKVFGVILKGAIQGAKDAILGIIKVLSGLMDFITGVFTGDWALAWDGIKKIFLGIVQAIWGFVNLYFFGKIFGGIKALFTKDIVGVIRRGGKFILLAVKHPFKLISAYWTFWMKGVRLAFTKWVGLIRKTFDVFKTIKDKVVGWMESLGTLTLKAVKGLRNGIKTAFEKIRGYIGKPILAVVDFVINKALIGGINTLLKWVGIKGKDGKGAIGTMPIPKGDEWKASGGVLSGFTPGRDVHHFVSPTGGKLHLSGGEAIMRPEWTKAVGGAAAVARMNAQAIAGKVQRFAKGGIFWPTTTKTLSADYPGHTGVDISGAGINGKPVFAAQAGMVSAANRWGYSYGTHARIAGLDGVQTIYGHMSKMMVKVGQLVKAGQQIGNVGSTGNSSGPHLHFEVRPGGTRAAALAYLNNGKIPKGGKSSDGVDNPKVDSLSGSALKALKNPLKWLSDRVTGGMSKVGSVGGGMGDFIKKIPGKFLSKAAGKVKDLAMKALDVGSDFFIKNNAKFQRWGSGGRGPNLYDNGGYLPPGLSMVMNKTGKPEPVLTNEQWDRMRSAGTGGGNTTWDINATGSDPEQVATLLVSKIQRQQRIAKRSGTLGRRGA